MEMTSSQENIEFATQNMSRFCPSKTLLQFKISTKIPMTRKLKCKYTTIEFLGNSHKPNKSSKTNKTKVHETLIFGHRSFC